MCQFRFLKFPASSIKAQSKMSIRYAIASSTNSNSTYSKQCPIAASELRGHTAADVRRSPERQLPDAAAPLPLGPGVHGNYYSGTITRCLCQDDSRGSEHTLDGSPFPLELHIVHKRTDLGTADIALQTHHGLAVAGFFFKIGVIRNQLAKISMTVCQL